jgi:uncharacterized protein YndB with AHSA1/START domain
MWKDEFTIDTTASPARIWRMFRDVPGWRKWHSDIDQIDIHGPFEVGTKYTKKPSGKNEITSCLIDVEENEAFTDETITEGVRIRVEHRLTPLMPEGTRITYTAVVTGPRAEELGPKVTADFPDVLEALVALAE